MVAAIYVRVSTEEQAQEGYSLAEQRESCRKRAEELGATSIIEFADEGVSGAVLERPGLTALRDAVKKGQINLIVCRDPDRLSRRLSHQLLITEEFEKKGAKLEFVDFTWQDTPEGRLFYSIKGAVAEFEKEKIRERMVRGKLQKAREGKLPISPRAYGYTFDPKTDTVDIVPVEAAVVKNIFQWFAEEDIGVNGIAKRLNALGVPSKKGLRWHRIVVDRILRNEIYTGTYWYNRHDASGKLYNKVKPKGEKVKPRPRPEKEWIAIPVPAIIDRELWQQAQEKLNKARRLWAGRSPSYCYLLTGVITCADCGCPMHGSTRQVWKKGLLPHYTCAQKGEGRSDVGCRPRKFVRADHLEQTVWNLIKEWLSNPDALTKEIADSLPDQREIAREIEKLEKELAVAEKGRSNLIAAMAAGILDLTPEVKNNLTHVKEKIKTLENKLEELRLATKGDIIDSAKKHLIKMAEGTLDNIDDLSPEDKKSLVRTLIEQVLVHGKGENTSITVVCSLAPYQIEIKGKTVSTL